jgi:hypothetical protein
VKLPFELSVPEGETFQLRDYEDRGFVVRVDTPRRSGDSSDESLQLKLNGKPAFRADVLCIHFYKEEIDRRLSAEIDPPFEVMNDAIRDFLDRVRYLSKAPQVQPVELPMTAYRLDYLTDEGEPLPEEEGLATNRMTMPFSVSWIACDSSFWDLIYGLPGDFKSPEWRNLLTDAHGAMPHIGSAITLAATALEVFAAQTLNALQRSSNIPDEIWIWLNSRKPNDPNVEEQLSTLLKILTGKSLKSDAHTLWQSFIRLKRARNSFVHTGAATIDGVAVTREVASELVLAAESITAQVREWLPEALRWPNPEHKTEVQFLMPLPAGTKAAG